MCFVGPTTWVDRVDQRPFNGQRPSNGWRHLTSGKSQVNTLILVLAFLHLQVVQFARRARTVYCRYCSWCDELPLSLEGCSLRAMRRCRFISLDSRSILSRGSGMLVSRQHLISLEMLYSNKEEQDIVRSYRARVVCVCRISTFGACTTGSKLGMTVVFAVQIMSSHRLIANCLATNNQSRSVSVTQWCLWY